MCGRFASETRAAIDRFFHDNIKEQPNIKHISVNETILLNQCTRVIASPANFPN
jgi:hypothetical protein